MTELLAMNVAQFKHAGQEDVSSCLAAH